MPRKDYHYVYIMVHAFLSLLVLLHLCIPINAWQWVNSKRLNIEWQELKDTCGVTIDGTGSACHIDGRNSLELFNSNDTSFRNYVNKLTRNNTLMISFITFPLVQHFMNFHCHIKKLKIDKHHLLFAMDEKVCQQKI